MFQHRFQGWPKSGQQFRCDYNYGWVTMKEIVAPHKIAVTL